MKPEDKKLLLRYLCTILPFGVKVAAVVSNGKPNTVVGCYELSEDFYIKELDGWFNISMIKPYIRPMSSMTEDEIIEYKNYITNEKDDQLRFCNELIFYNKHHLDYLGLIGKGIALEAPEDMYK